MTVFICRSPARTEGDVRSATSEMSGTATRRHDPYAITAQPYRPQGIVTGVSHQPLLGRCMYLAIPKLRKAQAQPTSIPAHAAIQLQLRQIRFEAEPSQIRWLVRALTGVHVIKAETAAPGVVNIWVKSQSDADRVYDLLDQKVLFDYQGAFVATDCNQHQVLVSYLKTRQFHTRSQRLPREFVTICTINVPPSTPPYQLKGSSAPWDTEWMHQPMTSSQQSSFA
jgi:hypothetical protein